MTVRAGRERSACRCPASRRASRTPRRGERLPEGKTGVLEVRGPNVFGGYWRMPGKSAEEFRPDGFFITGDLARIEEDGYIVIVGPSEGSRDFGRLQRLSERGRERNRRHRRRSRIRRDRVAASRLRGRRRRRRRADAGVNDFGSRYSGSAFRDVWPNTNSRNACCSHPSCPATRWARCRRISCVIGTREFLPGIRGLCFAAEGRTRSVAGAGGASWPGCKRC